MVTGVSKGPGVETIDKHTMTDMSLASMTLELDISSISTARTAGECMKITDNMSVHVISIAV